MTSCTKCFGQTEALKGTDLEVCQEELVAFLGPNGAGKITAISILLGLALLLGSVPPGLLGIALGYWVQAKAALPAANLLYLGLAYAGGLWVPPKHLPHPAADISPYLPTRLSNEVTWTVVQGQTWRLEPWLGLVAYAVGIGFLAIWGYRRDEGQNYR